MSGGELVFVYGTLRRGCANAFRMEGAEYLRDGWVRGRLYFTEGYPGFVPDPREDWVVGELWRVSPPKFAELDAYEAECSAGVEWAAFVRERVTVARGHPEPEPPPEAWCWVWAGVQRAECRIPTGDWSDVERPRPPVVLTALGCLSILAVPVGGIALTVGLGELFPGSWPPSLHGVDAFLLLLLAPVAPWVLFTLASRRREQGEGLRRATRAVLMLLALAAVAVLCMFLVGGA